MKDILSVPEAPTPQSLHEAALAHLARFASTRLGVKRVLTRRLKRWALKAEKAGIESDVILAKEQSLLGSIEKILDNMTELRVLDDESFARSRTRNLLRTGRSRRAVQAHLLQKGVETDLVEDAVRDTLEDMSEATGEEAEFIAALILARKRAVGPFIRPDREAKDSEKILAIFARNGFSRDIALRALTMDRDEAEDMIYHFRSL